MSFQLPPNTTSGGSVGFSFGLPTNTTAPAPSFSFGSNAEAGAGAAKPLTFGVSTQQQPTATQPSMSTTAAIQPILGKPVTTTTAAIVPQTLGGGIATSSIPSAAPALTTIPALPTNTAVVPTQSALGLKTTTNMSSLPVASGVSATTAAGTGIGSAAATTATTNTGGAFANLSTATKTTESAAMAGGAMQISYRQLEDYINKWTLQLEEQEKIFTDQATQINAWDNILIANNEKIMALNDAVEKVKTDQQSLEQELEFIATQHKELEESIVPLQSEVMRIPQIDVDRSQTYLTVENLDTQLKQMSEDLKEIIDNLNETSRGQDNGDPIDQIGKILNAHMNSLQWIDTSSVKICKRLDEITQMQDNLKRDSERASRSAYYN